MLWGSSEEPLICLYKCWFPDDLVLKGLLDMPGSFLQSYFNPPGVHLLAIPTLSVYSFKVSWSDGTTNIIYRRYSEVHQLERSLLERFPCSKRERFIPSLQGRIKLVPTSVHTKVDRIRDFLLSLNSLPEHISKCQLVISFFTPKPEDLESVEPKTPGSRKKSKRNTAGSILRKISLGNSKTARCIGEPVLLEQYVVLENYQKQYHNDISLTKGHTVGVLEKHESGWWHVDCEGDLGWVPASFIKPVYGDNDDNGERFPAGKEEIYMTTNSYQAEKEDEISFDIGVNLHVIEKTLDGWWRVVYMNEEGWAPAVFLKRVGVATGNSPAILKRLPMMSMQLRDKASDTEETPKTTLQDKKCSLLTPVWNTHRRHSASEVSELIKERKERKFPSRRSTLGSTGVLRDAIANRGLSISECDLRLANQREEEPKAPETLKRNRSFSFPDNMKEIFGKNNVSENLSSEGGQTSVNIPSSRPLRSRSFSDSPDPSNMVAGSKRLLNLREFRGSLPSICITPSASDAEYSPSLARKLGSSLGDVENTGGNQCRNLNVNSRSQETATEEEEKENGKHQPQGIVKEDDIMYQRKIVPCTSEISLKDFPEMDTRLMDETRVLEVVMNTDVQNGGSSVLTPSPTHRRHSTSELGVPPLRTESQSSFLRRSNRDLRDALPNRGLSISELDLRVAVRNEGERMAGGKLKQNRSFSLTSNIKDFFGKTNSTEIMSSRNDRNEGERMAGEVLKQNRSFSLTNNIKDFFGKTNSTEIMSSRNDRASKKKSKLKYVGSEKSLSGRKSRASLPSICITPPASDTENSTRLSRNLGTITANVQAPGGNQFITNNVDKLEPVTKTRGQENNRFGAEEREPNAFNEKKCVTKLKKREENKQRKQQVGGDNLCYYNEEGVHHVQDQRERDSQTEKHGMDREETKKGVLDKRVFDEEEQDNSHSMICRVTDTYSYFVVCTYVASGDGEMTVYEGDEVEVLSKAPNGWWMVCIDDEVGWVPSNFLVAEGEQEDDASQSSLELEDGKKNARLSSDDYDGDDDEREHENGSKHGDDDEEVEEECFDNVSGIANLKDEDQSVIWAPPDEKPTQQKKRVHSKRCYYRGSSRLSCNECWFDPVINGQNVIRRSSGTWSNSSTETNSSNSDKPARYERRRGTKSGKSAFISDKQAYSTEKGHTMLHPRKAPSSSKEAACRQQKWYKRFEGMSGAGCLSREQRSLFTGSHRRPQAKHKNLLSYDSGFPEDERTNAVRRMRKSLSLPDARANQHKWLPHSASNRPYHSQFDDGYPLSILPEHRRDIAPLNAFHGDNSSDGEVFRKTKHPSLYEDSSYDYLAVHSYTGRPRKKINRSQLSKNSSQRDAPRVRKRSGGQSSKLAYKAIASYRVSTGDTINLHERDKVRVIWKSRGGWWFLKIDDEEG